MNKIARNLVLACAVGLAGYAFAGEGNAIITFKTEADYYADGTPVKAGEWYALCWSKSDTFSGLNTNCSLVDTTNDKVFIFVSRAKQKTVGDATIGYCPKTNFQIPEEMVPVEGKFHKPEYWSDASWSEYEGGMVINLVESYQNIYW